MHVGFRAVVRDDAISHLLLVSNEAIAKVKKMRTPYTENISARFVLYEQLLALLLLGGEYGKRPVAYNIG